MDLFDALNETAARQGLPEVERVMINWLAVITTECVESIHTGIGHHLQERNERFQKTRNALRVSCESGK